jgi:hypothetical protein
MTNAEPSSRGSRQPVDGSEPICQRDAPAARSTVHHTPARGSELTARDLPAAEVAAFLRSLVGLPPAVGEGAVDGKRPAPRTVDASAWIGWALAGLYACALPGELDEDEDDDRARRRGPWVPPIRRLVAEARRVAVVVAMHRHGGNLSSAAKALGTSRRALRESLKVAGLYPWAGASATDDGEDRDDAADVHDDASTTTDDDACTEGGQA